jgi:PKD repeat protein
MNLKITSLTLCMLFFAEAFSQNVPELMYYKFNNSGTQDNLASSAVGNNPSSIVGSSLAIGTPAQFGNALTGTGASSSSNYVNNGWATNLVSTPWTISMWINNIPSGSTLYYLFGDAGNSMRCFVNGAPGSGNMRLTGTGLPSVNVTGVTGGAYVIHFVRTTSPNEIKVYKNGSYVTSYAITSTPTTGSGFRIGGYSSNSGLHGEMDEFRMYNRALTATEISNTWNTSLGSKVPDNAGVVKLTYPQVFCQGNSDVKVLIENAGSNKLDSLRVNWTLDGTAQTPILITTALDTAGSTAGNTREITLGNINFSTAAGKNFKVWTSHPNGVTDTVNANDTISFSLKPSLSGSFTIGGSSPDYNNFTDAINDLKVFGVCGPVTFTIRAGTYNEQVTIPEISGASAANSITFDGVDASTRIITFAGTSADPQTIQLDGADHITIKNLGIRNTSTTKAFTLHLTNEADSNNISGCVITNNNTTTSSNFVALGIMGTTYTTYGNHGNYNTIENCAISGGYLNVVLNGISTSSYCYGNRVLNCDLSFAYLYGIRSYYQSENEFSGNSIIIRSGTASSYGIYCYYNNGGFQLNRNRIKSYTRGFYLSSCNTGSSTRASVSNNVIWGQGGTVYQIYCLTVNNTDFFHNTTHNTGTGGYNLYFSGGSNNRIMNNIFSKTVAGTYLVYLVSASAVTDIDYNNYYSAAGGNFVYLGTAYTSLANLQASTSDNQNSISQQPNFISTSSGSEDFHLTATVMAPYGTDLGVAVDIDNDARCSFAPTLGADESTYPVLAPVAGFNLPDSVFVNSPATFLNAATAGEAKGHKWYLNGNLVSGNVHFSQTFSSTGTDTLKLVTQSCGGIDSITRLVGVHNPTRVPLSDFVADKNQIEAFEDVTFTDLSENGASSWNWTVIPSTGVTISSASAQNPVMSFTQPGDYQVCLKAENSIGSGNTECKTAYIRVGALEYFCSGSGSNASIGVLYDAGGPLTNYGPNENCSFLIDPCASSVTLKFNVFNMGNVGDVLKIYDGKNASGTLLGTFTSTSGTPGGSTGITAVSGKMFLQWKSDNTTHGAGFEAEWTSVPASFPKPVVSFTMPDTAYIDQPVHFKSSSTGDYLTYAWDVDAPNGTPGNNGGFMEEEVYIYPSPATYNVKLTVLNCGGLDTLSKPIVIINPTSVPNPVDFKASYTRLTLQDTAQLTDMSGKGPSAWEWTAFPSTGVTFLPDNKVYNPRITISTPGLYDIKLVASNSLGKDSITKTAYIRAVSYCYPSVANLNDDIGISRVKLNGASNSMISNSSEIGTTGYTDYSQNSQLVNLELGETFTLEVERNSVNNKMNRRVWVDYNGDGDFDDANEEVASESSANTLLWTTAFTVPSNARLGHARMRIGTNLGSMANLACGPNSYGEFEDYRVVITEDITRPIITLAGPVTVYLEQYRAYTDAGATATDNLNGNLTAGMYAHPNTITSLGTDVPGTYYLYFNVSDSSGNNALQKVRTVHIAPDTTKPVIMLNGPASMKVQVLTGFTDPGASATDFRSAGNIPVAVTTSGIVDPNVIGNYVISYMATDSMGNVMLADRLVEVLDTIAPAVSLVGSDTVYVEVKSAYTDQGIITSDNYYPLPSLTITSDAATVVNSNKTGTYTVTYTVTDGSGNAGILQRIVIVEDTQKPLLLLLGSATEIIEVYSQDFNDPGVIVNDNYDTLTYTRIGTYNLGIVGDYPLQYIAVDNSGNVSDTLDRLLKVVDTQKPVITIVGDEYVYIERWAPYFDSGAVVTDNYYNGLSAVVTNNVSTLKEGIYYVYYDITDGSGNVADRVSRKVIVGSNTTGTGSNLAGTGLKIYPNPTHGKIMINSERGSLIRAEVYNTIGGLVQTSADLIQSANMELDLGDLPGGVYYIKVETSNGVTTTKIIIAD